MKMMNFLKRQVGCYLKNNFKINNLILKRVSIANISKVIDKYKNDNKIVKKNLDVFSEYITTRSNPIDDYEELKTLIKMVLEYNNITHKQMDKFKQLFKKLISLYPNIKMKDYSEIYNLVVGFGGLVQNLKFVIFDNLSIILTSEKNLNADFIKNNYQYIFNMKSCPYLKSLIEKNYGETLNLIDDFNLITNSNYLLFLIYCKNCLNDKKKKQIFDNLKVNEIVANKSDIKDYLGFIFENNFDNCDRRLVEIINNINKNKETRIIHINNIYGYFDKFRFIDKKNKYLFQFYESTISILDEIDRKKNQNELLDLYCFISNKYTSLRCFMFMNDNRYKSIFENFHNNLFEFYDGISELTPKILNSYKEKDLSHLLTICKNSSSKNIMDDKLTCFFDNNKDFLMSFSLKRKDLFSSSYFIISFIGLSKSNKKYILLLKKVKNFF